MIRITVELVPWYSGIPKTIGRMEIANEGGSESASHGNYTYQIWLRRTKEVWKEGRVENFPRKYKNIWHLVKLVLRDAIADARDMR